MPQSDRRKMPSLDHDLLIRVDTKLDQVIKEQADIRAMVTLKMDNLDNRVSKLEMNNSYRKGQIYVSTAIVSVIVSLVSIYVTHLLK